MKHLNPRVHLALAGLLGLTGTLALGCTTTHSSEPKGALSIETSAQGVVKSAATPSPPRTCERRDLGPIGGGATLELERCTTAPFAALVATMGTTSQREALDDDLGAPNADWQAFPTRFRAVPSPTGSITTLVFHRRNQGKDAWALRVIELTARSIRTVARVGPVEGESVLSHAVEDLDGDGNPELRVGIAKRFHGERVVETHSLGPTGFDQSWTPAVSAKSASDAVLCDEADRALRHVSPDAPRLPCDPILDFARAHVEGPGDHHALLVASGPYSACDGRGCPLVVLREREGAPEVLLRSFGFVAVSPARPGARFAIAVLKAPGDEAGSQRYCFKHGALARCRGHTEPALAPWASLAPVRIDSPD